MTRNTHACGSRWPLLAMPPLLLLLSLLLPHPLRAQTTAAAPAAASPAAPAAAAAPAATQEVIVATPQLEQHGPDAPFTLSVTTNEVNLIFTVTDRNNHFVTGLQPAQFGLLDAGMAPEKVISFKQQTDLPLRVGIMLDTSSSIRQRFAFEQQAATDFLLQVLQHQDYAFVEGFDVSVELTQDFTNRIDLLSTGINKLRPAGGTSLYDSLYRTCRDQMLTLKGSGNVRKALVLVSDGDDNYSRVQENEAIKMCQRAATGVYTISTNSGPSRDPGDDVLQRIADATGGQAFFPTRIEDVSQGFHLIEEALRSQYSLVYRPADFKDNGAFRTIYLQSTDPRYTVRAEKGYFAPKAPR